jgi:hypothetical protein
LPDFFIFKPKIPSWEHVVIFYDNLEYFSIFFRNILVYFTHFGTFGRKIWQPWCKLKLEMVPLAQFIGIPNSGFVIAMTENYV